MTLKKPFGIMFVFLFIIVVSAVNTHAEEYDAEQEAAQRIKRQLELANEMREKRLKKQREKEKQYEQEEQLQKRCARLKDELRRLGERRRWYRLNEQGERVYLSEAEVRHKKDSLQNQFDQRCEEFR
jgi:hypothetical protein